MVDPAALQLEKTSLGAATCAAPTFSRFEFWPTWLMYVPVVGLWLCLALRHRCARLPFMANPAFPLSGMMGASKARILRAAAPSAEAAILPWLLHRSGDSVAGLLQRCAAADIPFPMVVKPDVGCRGSGVKLVRDETALAAVLSAWPLGMPLMVQRCSQLRREVGVFWLRLPGHSRGRIVSLTEKETPTVVGDGQRTLGQLVAADARAGQVQHLYRERNAAHWQRVLALGERHDLVFSASHCRGAVFRDLRQAITPALEARMQELLGSVAGFHYGRLDVKYADTDALARGEGLEIIEINGASSEAIHIWDARTTVGQALATLCWQYRTLFRIGAALQRQGQQAPAWSAIRQALRREFADRRHHPATD
ncbi:MAG: D-alanine--D-alanine ligase [Planctomycetota bacterium]|nr:MAG: D-alanine--D-alanine ligase [Planctomycetota bacterium]